MLHQRYSNAETILCDNAMRDITDSTFVYAEKSKKREKKYGKKRETPMIQQCCDNFI